MVQRFKIMHESFFNPDDKGQFVSYQDYAALERERDGMQIEIVGLQSALQNQMKCVGELKEFLHNAEAANALLRKERDELKAAFETGEKAYDELSEKYFRLEAANARLIAAAPELLEALKWLNAEFECRDDDFGGVLFTRNDFDRVRKAIAKAEGGEGGRP